MKQKTSRKTACVYTIHHIIWYRKNYPALLLFFQLLKWDDLGQYFNILFLKSKILQHDAVKVVAYNLVQYPH